MSALQSSALTLHHDIDAEARIHDEELGRRLGYARPRVVRELIARNEAELQRYGGLPCRAANPGRRGGRPTQAYYLNEPQALLICMKSDAPVAADIRQEVIEVYMAFRQAAAEARFGLCGSLQMGSSTHETEPFVTLDLFRALRNERWRRSFSSQLGLYTSRLAARRGVALRKQLVRYSGGVGTVNAYPQSLLDEAYSKCAVLLSFAPASIELGS